MPWNELMGEGYLQTRKDWLTRPEEQKWMLHARSIMLRHLGRPFKGQSVLDVGCSAGHGARTFLAKPVGHRAKADDVEYIGLDNEMEYLRLGSDFFIACKPQVCFYHHDIGSPELAEPRADFVICNNVLIHLPRFRRPLFKMLVIAKQMLIWRTMLGDEEIIWKDPKTGIHLNQYALTDVLPFIHGSGFDVKLVRDAYLDSVPQLVWADQVRTYYVVVARRHG